MYSEKTNTALALALAFAFPELVNKGLQDVVRGLLLTVQVIIFKKGDHSNNWNLFCFLISSIP